MNKESFEKTAEIFKNNYQNYVELGGIINEKDYDSALTRLKEAEIEQDIPNKSQIKQAEVMLNFAGIELVFRDIYRMVKLYSILRDDVRSEGVKYHHDQMCDQQIFVEALRMLGDIESRDKMINAYPNISFEYEKGK